MKAVGITYIVQHLKKLGSFYFWPNNGNLEDYLIAEATRQLFEQEGIAYKEYNPQFIPQDKEFTLVYGGGGRFISHWIGTDTIQAHMLRPQVKQCIILPHSIHEVDEFVQALDERFTVFCREEKTLTYCQKLNKKATFFLAHDLGLYLNKSLIYKIDELTTPENKEDKEAMAQYAFLTQGLTALYAHKLRRATVSILGSRKKTAFILRTDKEKQTLFQSPFAFDLSSVWNGSCRKTPYSLAMVRWMAEVLSYPDVIVTDRLHVAIMGMHLEKEVYMLDNDYGKLSGVYEVSLQDKPNMHLLPTGKPWPKKIQRAWKILNAPYRHWYYQARALAGRMIRKLRAVLCKG